MIGKWLNKIINGASTIDRWQGRRKLIKRNDAEHMWSVAVICEALARIEKDIFNKEVDVTLLLQKALFHDVLEVETGDILSSVKRKTPEIKQALDNVETIYYNERIRPLIPDSWREEYYNFIVEPKDGLRTLEGQILATADNIDALIECIQEVKLGNSTFKPYLEEISNEIIKINSNSGIYFIKNCLKDFDIPLKDFGQKVINLL